MSEDAQNLLREIKSLCFMPLLLDGRCIGSLGLHSKTQKTFSNEKREIAKLVAERLALALHDLLVEEKARRREEARVSTIGMVLHNINTPLGTLNNELEFLLGEVKSSRANNQILEAGLNRMKVQAGRIARIRSEYLKLNSPYIARIESVDLPAFLSEVSRECAKDVPFIFKNELHLLGRAVRLDATGLRVCLEVLLGNAVDALTGAANPAITVILRQVTGAETERAESPGPIVAIDVLDNGAGVPPDIQTNLFQVVKSGKSKGLGFGLSFCRHVASSNGGSVYYHAEQSDGARFTLLFPIKTTA